MRKLALLTTLIIFSTIITFGITQIPKVTLDSSEINSYDKNSVYVSGSVSEVKGQRIVVKKNNLIIAGQDLQSSKFKIKIPAAYISGAKNHFTVKSMKLKGVLNSSIEKPVTINILPKKNQTITASGKSVKTGQSVNIGATTNSKLALAYKSSNAAIATVDKNGKVTGKKAGKATITISQGGNSTFNAASKNITITVTPGSFTIRYNPNGGSGKSYTQTITWDAKTKTTLNKFTRTGYKFVGWCTDPYKSINKNWRKGQVSQTRKPEAAGIVWSKLKDSQKQYMVNGFWTKNICDAGQTIDLYAVWEATRAERIAQTAEYYAWPYQYRNQSSKWSYSKGRAYRTLDTVGNSKYAFARKGACCCHWARGVVRKALSVSIPETLLPNTTSKTSAKKTLQVAVKATKNYSVFQWDGKISSLRRGDILSFCRKSGGGHVMIYLGNKRMANAGSASRYGMIDDFSGSNAKTSSKYYYYVVRIN